jgi:hypothetical protein
MGKQIFAFNNLNGRKTSGARHRVLFVSVMTQSFVAGHIQALSGDNRSQREHASAQTFAQHQDVRNDAIMFKRKHAARATKANRYFIQDEEDTMLVASCPNAFPIVGRRNEGSAPNSLGNHCGDVTLSRENVFDVIGAGKVAGVTAFEWAMAIVWRWNMFTSGQEGPDSLAERRFSSHGDSVKRGPMERFPHRNKLKSSGCHSGQFERHANGAGAARRKQDPI